MVETGYAVLYETSLAKIVLDTEVALLD